MNLWRLTAKLLRYALRTAMKPTARRAARAKPRSSVAGGVRNPAHAVAVPPGAPADWLRGVRSGRSRLQSFPPFDVVLDYQDNEGEWSVARRVTVARLEIETFGGEIRPGVLYLHGWCHERRALRTFRADRIRSLHDAMTGEIANDAREWLLARVRG